MTHPSKPEAHPGLQESWGLPQVWIYGAAVILALLPVTARAADPEANMKVIADAARPLSSAAEAIQRRYGVAVTYEDPMWLYSGDLVPVASKPAGGGALGKGDTRKPRMMPAGTSFEVELIPTPTAPLLTPLAVLDATLQQHQATGQPGRFRVQQDGDFYHLIPDQVKNAKGQWTLATPILDTALTLPSATRSGATTLRLICDEIASSTGQQILIGQVPLNLLMPAEVTLGGATRPARELLADLAGALAHRASWRLAWDPNLQSFLLNMTVVPEPTHEMAPLERRSKNKFSSGGKG